MDDPIKMDDLGVPLFSETSIYTLYPKHPELSNRALAIQKNPALQISDPLFGGSI